MNKPADGPWRVPRDMPRQVHWNAEKDRIDLIGVITREIGPGQVRNGRALWLCPFHEERTPSFLAKTLNSGKQAWRCFGCGAKGDVADFVMRLRSLTFPEAVAHLTGGAAPADRPRVAKVQARRGPPKPDQPEGWHKWALGLVEDAERRLWGGDGARALDYLYRRGLGDGAIKGARLGLVTVRRSGAPEGVTIPWFDGPRLTMVNVRRPDGCRPKYMVFKGSRRGGVYPGRQSVKPGVPLVVVEGELDALLLGQELAGLAAVVTLGSAGDRPDRRVLAAFLSAPRWFAAHDADEAGEAAASAWLEYGRCRRVRPPLGKDWTDAAARGVDLRRWWQQVFAGAARPPVFTWEELSAWRWGPAPGDPEPGLHGRNGLNPAIIARALDGEIDPYVSEERLAIQTEHLAPATD